MTGRREGASATSNASQMGATQPCHATRSCTRCRARQATHRSPGAGGVGLPSPATAAPCGASLLEGVPPGAPGGTTTPPWLVGRCACRWQNGALVTSVSAHPAQACTPLAQGQGHLEGQPGLTTFWLPPPHPSRHSPAPSPPQTTTLILTWKSMLSSDSRRRPASSEEGGTSCSCMFMLLNSSSTCAEGWTVLGWVQAGGWKGLR